MPKNTWLVNVRAGIFLLSNNKLIYLFQWAAAVLALQREKDGEERLPVKHSSVSTQTYQIVSVLIKKEEFTSQHFYVLEPGIGVSLDQRDGKVQ